MTGFQPDEIVDVTIRGARVVEEFLSGIVLRLPPEGESFEVPLADEVTLTRVAPAEWPPVVEDVWRDSHTNLWFAVDVSKDDDTVLVVLVRGVTGDRFAPAYALSHWGPMELVRREGESR